MDNQMDNQVEEEIDHNKWHEGNVGEGLGCSLMALAVAIIFIGIAVGCNIWRLFV